MFVPQPAGLEGVYKQVELAGRTAYKSEDKITDVSAEKFVKMLMNKKHGAALEHGTIYLKYRCKWEGDNLTEFYERNPYSSVIAKLNKDDYENGWAMSTFYITTNYRVIVENNRSQDLKYLSNPCKYHERRYTFKFILSRGKAYLSEKESACLSQDKVLLYAYCNSEHLYLSLLDKGMKPQIARDVLPLGLKTELIMTGTKKQWEEFINLRSANDAHPDARILAEEVKKILL